jgi:hypothetical protein
LIGALLAEQHEVWQERRYLDMDQFNEWKTARATPERVKQFETVNFLNLCTVGFV